MVGIKGKSGKNPNSGFQKGNQVNKGRKPWNFGLTKDTDERVRKYVEQNKGNKYALGHKQSEKQKRMTSERQKGESNVAKRKDVRKKISKSKIKFYKDNPNAGKRLSMLGRKAQAYISISKPQMELYLLIKVKYPEAELEYPIQTKHSTRFADIAIPSLKVDIEYDGLEWHQNKQLDELRDKHLAEIGWITIHITKDNVQLCLNKLKEINYGK